MSAMVMRKFLRGCHVLCFEVPHIGISHHLLWGLLHFYVINLALGILPYFLTNHDTFITKSTILRVFYLNLSSFCLVTEYLAWTALFKFLFFGCVEGCHFGFVDFDYWFVSESNACARTPFLMDFSGTFIFISKISSGNAWSSLLKVYVFGLKLCWWCQKVLANERLDLPYYLEEVLLIFTQLGS